MPDYDVVVVGAGPGGYVAAIRAAQLGLTTAMVEREQVGGICLNWGCIPSKALLRNAEIVTLFRHADEYGVSYDNLKVDFGKAIDRSRSVVQRLTRGVESLLRKNKVDLVKGTGVLRGNGQVEIKEGGGALKARSIILATGARQRSLPSLPIDGKTIITSREALALKQLPGSAVIVGGGATGCEFAYLYAAYGVKVTVVELLPRLLPTADAEVSTALEKAFAQQGITVMTGTKVNESKVGQGARLSVEGAKGVQELVCDLVLVCVGIQGNIEDIGLEAAGVGTERGLITVDEQLRTTARGVFAIGDVTGKLPLAHVASAQGVAVVERLAGKEVPPPDYSLMPRAVYCQPQVASWGLTEEEAAQSGRKVKIGRFPMQASGKALAMGERQGFVKVLVDAEYGEIVGAHLIGPEVTELLAELSMAKMLEGTAREVGWLTHAHPTLSETVKEAALAALGEAIHI